eukprot:514310_1
MGATHSKAAAAPQRSTNPLKQHVRGAINSKLFWRAICIHIDNEARKHNIHLPSDIITLCMKHISFIIHNTILTRKEEMDLFEHLQSKITLENDMRLLYGQLLYQHQFVVPFDMEAFVKTLENKSNVLILFCTEFNHIISLFITQRIQRIALNCNMHALLLRSQFCQCPKELSFRVTHFHWDVQRDVIPGITFGVFGIYAFDKGLMKMSMYSQDIENIDGNQVFGGKSYTKGPQHCNVKLKRIQMYHMFY